MGWRHSSFHLRPGEWAVLALCITGPPAPVCPGWRGSKGPGGRRGQSPSLSEAAFPLAEHGGGIACPAGLDFASLSLWQQPEL